jgi:hypothetical protein
MRHRFSQRRMILKTLFIVAFFVVSLPYAQDPSGYDAYDDSIAAAAKVIPKIQPEDSQVNDTSCVSQVDSAKVDSFEAVIASLDSAWNACERLRDYDSVGDRIGALKYYLNKSTMTKKEVAKFAQLCLDKKHVEYEGTRYLIDCQCGSERVKAHAHLKKVQMEMKIVSDYVFELNNSRTRLQPDNHGRIH